MCAGFVVAALLAAAPQTTVAPPRPQVTNDSLRRIRAALAQPDHLRVETPEPTFKTEIRQHPFFTDVPHTWDFSGGGTPTAAPRPAYVGTPPAVKFEVLPLLREIRNAWAEREARGEVSREMAEFCATHACEPR